MDQKSVTNLDQAIQYYHEAINPDPGEGPDPVLYSSLASAIYVCCQDFVEVDGVTLEHTFSYRLNPLHSCPQDDPLYLKIRNDLGSIHSAQLKNSGDEGDLAKGVLSSEDTIPTCPPDNEDYILTLQRPLKLQNGFSRIGAGIIRRHPMKLSRQGVIQNLGQGVSNLLPAAFW